VIHVQARAAPAADLASGTNLQCMNLSEVGRDQAAIETSELPKRGDRALMGVTHAEGERRHGVRCRISENLQNKRTSLRNHEDSLGNLV